MRIEQLEQLLAVVQYRSISKASEKLFINQPTLSSSIRALEKELGVTLLERTRTGVILTQTGKNLLPIVESVVCGAGKLMTAAQIADSIECTVSVCACPMAASMLMREILPFLRKCQTINRFHLKECYAGMVIKEVASKKATIGITAGNERAQRQARLFAAQNNLVMQQLRKDDELLLVCGNDHPLAQAETVPFQHLKEFPYALFEGSLPMNSLTATYTTYQGFKEIYLFSDQHTLINALYDEHLATILPSEALQGNVLYEEAKLVCRQLSGYDTHISYYVIYRNTDTLTSLERTLLKLVHKGFCQ